MYLIKLNEQMRNLQRKCSQTKIDTNGLIVVNNEIVLKKKTGTNSNYLYLDYNEQ